MVTSKKFHISLVLLFISGIFNFIGAFSFLNTINGIPHAFGFLTLFEFIGYVIVLIVAIRLRKVNRYFFYAFILAIITIILTVTSPILFLFDFVAAIDAINEGLTFTQFFIDLLATLYIVLGLRDCYNKDEDVSKNMSHGFFYALLIASGVSLIMMVLSSLDFVTKSFAITMIANMLSYLTTVGTATILLICYSRALHISHKTLMAIKARESEQTTKEINLEANKDIKEEVASNDGAIDMTEEGKNNETE